MKRFSMVYVVAMSTCMFFGQAWGMDLGLSSLGQKSEQKKTYVSMPQPMRELINFANDYIYLDLHPSEQQYPDYYKGGIIEKIQANIKKTVTSNTKEAAMCIEAIEGKTNKFDIINSLLNNDPSKSYIQDCKSLQENILTYHFSRNPEEICQEAKSTVTYLPDDQDNQAELTKIDKLKILFKIRNQEPKALNKEAVNAISQFLTNNQSQGSLTNLELKNLVEQICATPLELIQTKLSEIKKDTLKSVTEKKNLLQALYIEFVRLKPTKKVELAGWLKTDGKMKDLYKALKKEGLMQKTKEIAETVAFSMPEDWTQSRISQTSEEETQNGFMDIINRSMLFTEEPESITSDNAIHNFVQELPIYCSTRFADLNERIDSKAKLLDYLETIEFFVFDVIQRNAEKTGVPADSSDRLWRIGLIKNKIMNDNPFTAEQTTFSIQELQAIHTVTKGQLQRLGDTNFISEVQIDKILNLSQPLVRDIEAISALAQPEIATESTTEKDCLQQVELKEYELKKSRYNSKLLKEYLVTLQTCQKKLKAEDIVNDNIEKKINSTKGRLSKIKVLAPRKKTDDEIALSKIIEKRPLDQIASLPTEHAQQMHAALKELYEKIHDQKIKTKIMQYLTALAPKTFSGYGEKASSSNIQELPLSAHIQESIHSGLPQSSAITSYNDPTLMQQQRSQKQKTVGDRVRTRMEKYKNLNKEIDNEEAKIEQLINEQKSIGLLFNKESKKFYKNFPDITSTAYLKKLKEKMFLTPQNKILLDKLLFKSGKHLIGEKIISIENIAIAKQQLNLLCDTLQSRYPYILKQQQSSLTPTFTTATYNFVNNTWKSIANAFGNMWRWLTGK